MGIDMTETAENVPIMSIPMITQALSTVLVIRRTRLLSKRGWRRVHEFMVGNGEDCMREAIWGRCIDPKGLYFLMFSHGKKTIQHARKFRPADYKKKIDSVFV
jgi:hypothetical protein